MLEEIKKYNNFYQQVLANFSNKANFFHAYIIETYDNEESEKIIDILIKYIFSRKYENNSLEYKRICTLIDKNSFYDYQKIFPENNVIKKEQLTFVKNKFKNKSFNSNQVYVIFDADKLNSHASNTILKFLEEPNDGVIAFFVVKNRYMLLDTIISRCQILTMDQNISFSSDNSTLVHFFKIFSSLKNAFLNYDLLMKELFIDKKVTIELLDLLEKRYYDYICNSCITDTNKDLEEYFNNLSIKQALKIVNVIDNEKSKLNYNVNFKIWLDNFIIKFMEVKENV